METPKQKAEQLVKRMQLNDNWGEISQGQAIDCALILVDEILIFGLKTEAKSQIEDYWWNVRKELESL